MVKRWKLNSFFTFQYLEIYGIILPQIDYCISMPHTVPNGTIADVAVGQGRFRARAGLLGFQA
jgi:hypothetical protein